MTDLFQYDFYDGAFFTIVDRANETVTMYERGGWGADYKITFKQLLFDAQNWDLKINLTDTDQALAKIATNIICANNAASHNLDPYQYVPRSDKITDPRDKAVINKFEKIFDTYTPEKILEAMSYDKKILLKNSLNK